MPCVSHIAHEIFFALCLKLFVAGLRFLSYPTEIANAAQRICVAAVQRSGFSVVLLAS